MLKYPSSFCTNDYSIFLDISGDVYVCGEPNYSYYLESFNEDDFKNIKIPKKINLLSNISRISCGEYHCVSCDNGGNVWGFGFNKYGELLSLPENIDCNFPQKLNIDQHISNVSCGINFTICIDINNNIWGFGKNDRGQLGKDSLKPLRKPKIVAKIDDLKECICSMSFILFLSYSGKVYGIGSSDNSQIGKIKDSFTSSIIEIKNLPLIKEIACGWYHSLALSDNGDVYGLGCNEFGEIGIDNNGKIVDKPTKLQNLPEILHISCGYRHSMCIDINNKLWLMGWNYHGQLGITDEDTIHLPFCSDIPDQVQQLSSGGNHTIITDINGKLWGAGRADKKQYGLDEGKNKYFKSMNFKDLNIHQNKSRQKSARK